jgi:hypothetical protein
MTNSVKNFSRCRVRSEPSFSKSEDMNIMKFCQVGNSSIVKTISKRPDVESTHVKRRVI